MKQLLALFSTSVSSAQGQDTDYQIANFNYYLAFRKPATCAIYPKERKKKIKSKLTKKIQNIALEEKSNLLLTKQFLRHSSLPVFVFLFFLRAIKFSILGIVGYFIDQAEGFVRSWLERGTSF